MKVKFFIVLLFVFGFSAFSQTKYVAVKNIPLRSSASNFAKQTGVLEYGQPVSVLKTDGSWEQVSAETNSSKTLTGWVKNSNLSERKIVSTKFSASTKTLALAGKGFGEELESQYQTKAIAANYFQINAIERLKFSDLELKKFINDGELSEEGNVSASKKNPSNESIYTPEQEYYLGRAVTANILAKYKIHNNSLVQKYITQILSTLALNCDRPALFNGYSIFVLKSDEINAFATPGGQILITRGLLKCADSEDALAAAIAHELSHILLGHSVKTISVSKKADAFGELTENMLNAICSKSEMADKIVKSFSLSVDDAVNAFNAGYSQTQEFEADSKAFAILKAAGYSQNALISMLEGLKQNESSGGSGLKNHPKASLRIKNIQIKNILSPQEKKAVEKRQLRFEKVKAYF